LSNWWGGGGAQLGAEQTATQHLSNDGTPVIVADAQDGWKARQLWSFGYFREHYGDEHVFCTDRVRALPPPTDREEKQRGVCLHPNPSRVPL
jgi:hypothetical protein